VADPAEIVGLDRFHQRVGTFLWPSGRNLLDNDVACVRAQARVSPANGSRTPSAFFVGDFRK
jgi:hypothetical protein